MNRTIRAIAWSCLSVILFTVTGCKPANHGAAYFMTPGAGITNALTWGMSAPEIKRLHPDAKILYYPKLRSWKKTYTRTRFPWQRPKRFEGIIPSLGVNFQGSCKRGIDRYIAFNTSPEVRQTYSTCEIILSVATGAHDIYTLAREDIVRLFGMPDNWITMGTPDQESLDVLDALGKPYGVRSHVDGIESERFVFPEQGIMFAVENRVVFRVIVFSPEGYRNKQKWYEDEE